LRLPVQWVLQQPQLERLPRLEPPQEQPVPLGLQEELQEELQALRRESVLALR
jgi:hypothetical protein